MKINIKYRIWAFIFAVIALIGMLFNNLDIGLSVGLSIIIMELESILCYIEEIINEKQT